MMQLSQGRPGRGVGGLAAPRLGDRHGVSTDTRAIRAGDLFFALRGANFDAHDFLPQAFAKGRRPRSSIRTPRRPA